LPKNGIKKASVVKGMNEGSPRFPGKENTNIGTDLERKKRLLNRFVETARKKATRKQGEVKIRKNETTFIQDDKRGEKSAKSHNIGDEEEYGSLECSASSIVQSKEEGTSTKGAGTGGSCQRSGGSNPL